MPLIFCAEDHFTLMDIIITFLSNTFDKLPTSFAIVFSALLAALVASRSINKQRQIAREKNSLDFEANYKHNVLIQKAWAEIHLLVGNSLNKPVEIWADKENARSTERDAIVLVLNEWERVAKGIFNKLYDGEYLYDIYGTIILTLHTRIHPFIWERQKHNRRSYVNFDRLVIDWRIKRSLEDKHKVDDELMKLQQAYCQLQKKHF